MRIMLINPSIPFEDSKAVALGPLVIGASLEQCGHDVKCIDMQVARLTDKDMVTEVGTWQPDIAGFSSLYFSYPYALKTAAKIKEKYPEVKIVFGGPHPSFEPSTVVSEDVIDYVVVGEGEVTLPALVAALEKGEQLTRVQGIAYKSNGNVMVTPSRPVIKSLDSIPHPAWHLLEREKMRDDIWGTIVTSRGCPFNCIFCATSAFHGHTMRFHSVDWVVKEFEDISHSFDKIMVGDDHFTIHKKRIVKICDELQKNGIKTNFWAETRADAVDSEIVYSLKRVGCSEICIGVESAEDKILKTIGKKITADQAKRAVKTVEGAGIEATTSFIVGLPGQTKKSVVESTLNFVAETKPTQVNVSILMLCSGAPVYVMPEKYGVEILKAASFITPFCTETMTWTDIVDAYDELTGSLAILSLLKMKPTRLHMFRNLKAFLKEEFNG